jgi:hypothetical protein
LQETFSRAVDCSPLVLFDLSNQAETDLAFVQIEAGISGGANLLYLEVHPRG